MSAHIEIKIHAGTPIESASEDAVRIANLLGITIEFTFNDVWCLAAPGGSAELLAQNQQVEQSRKLSGAFDRRFASSHLPAPRRRDGGM